MVIDTSILAAIFFLEAERETYLERMNSEPRILLSTASLVEIAVVLLRRGPAEVEQELDRFVRRAGIEVVPVDESQAVMAREAYRRFGKGRHPAQLNFGDCFSYALAMQTGEPLLFKGSDFSQTDVIAA